MKTTTQIIEITPEIATDWLTNKWGEQRGVRNAHVKRLASDMTAGRFLLGPDAILRIKGKLANGQHRLEAVVLSGESQKFIVMDSDDDELYKAIDGGLRRTVADGLIGMQYAKAIPAIANWVQVYEKGMLRPGARNGSEAHATANEGVFVTQSESINYCLENKDVLTEAASFIATLYCQTSILPASIGGAIYVIASSRNNQLEKAKSFLKDVYVDGGRSAAGDLRNRLIANKGSRSKLPLGYLFGITIKAYASFLNGSRPGCLKWEKGQKLPEV